MLACRSKLPWSSLSSWLRVDVSKDLRRIHCRSFLTAASYFQRDEDSLLFPFTNRHVNFQQIRWKRKDGHRFSGREREPSKKERKKYHRELKARFTSKHNAPGSQAGARREAEKEAVQAFMDRGDKNNNPLESNTYEIGDALLDDLMGNTLASQPTPAPVYYGHRHTAYYNRIQDNKEAATDKDISLVIRAFRDKHGTRRTQPVGLVAILSHVLKDLKVPLSSLGPQSYTSLLTCCQSPSEGRRVLQLMRDQQRPITPYSWSIQVDLYAKSGDWQGCLTVHREMLQEGVAPTLASYTSLISCCAQVCGDGRIAHSIRAEAAKAGWENWQEMFRSGIEADAMAYGALLRLWAARGLGERALDTLEEMQRFEVRPTTLCFTLALKAIARSHATSIRYEQGGSRRFGRREQVTLHHGKLTRSVLILAESAGVKQDDGFVAALTQCAAVAGDMATAKAIYLASQIRREFGPRLRRIGSDEHLARLRGEEVPDKDTVDLLEGGTKDHFVATYAKDSEQLQSYEWYAEREYGRDNRPLSAILLACSNAIQNKQLGSMWQGRENDGYLCINSLRLIAEPRKPEQSDNSIPGQKITDTLTWDGEQFGEDRKKGKFRGVWPDENVAANLDDLDEELSGMFLNEDGELKDEFRKASPDEIWRLKYGKEYEAPNAMFLPNGSDTFDTGNRLTNATNATEQTVISDGGKSDIYFDSETMSWKNKQADEIDREHRRETLDMDAPKEREISIGKEIDSLEIVSEETLDSFGDHDHSLDTISSLSEPETDDSVNKSFSASLDTKEFELFYSELCQEAKDNGEEVTEEEAKELFNLMKGEYNQMMQTSSSELGLYYDDEDEDDVDSGVIPDDLAQEGDAQGRIGTNGSINESTEQTAQFIDIRGPAKKTATVLDQRPGNNTSPLTIDFSSNVSRIETLTGANLDDDVKHFGDDTPVNLVGPHNPNESPHAELIQAEYSGLSNPSKQPTILDSLRESLPTFPDGRLIAIQKAFEKNLSDPSLFELVPLLRENMPDFVNLPWLKKMAFLTSKFVVHKAAQEELLDFNMINAVLALYASSGSLDSALKFHQIEFKRYNLKPNEYSDRLVLQMFLESNRFKRALDFKKSLENDGRFLDLKSYGSLIDYCSRRNQFGTAFVFVKECLSISGAAPGEAYLKEFRLLGRRLDVVDDVEKLIGPDPLEWLRDGEANRKREMSKKGRRGIQRAKNSFLRI